MASDKRASAYTSKASGESERLVRSDKGRSLWAVLIGVAVGWGTSFIPPDEEIQIVAGAASGLVTAILLLAFANTGDSGRGLLIRTTAWTLLIFAFVTNIALAVWCETARYFVLANGFWLGIFLLTSHSVIKSGTHSRRRTGLTERS